MAVRFYQDFKLGILGGGQLGRMLIQSCVELNIQTYVLDADESSPCRDFCTRFTQGSPSSFDDVYRFGKEMDLITIEVENVNTEALEKLKAEGVIIYPQPDVIRLIQDKRTQKEFFREHQIPTSEFVLIDRLEQLNDHKGMLPAVQKLGKAGYDGRGVMMLNTQADFSKAFDAPSILEKRVDFEKEISIILARSVQGEVRVFPAVEMVFHPQANLVEYLMAPATISEAIETHAKEIAIKIADKLNIIGLLAVEMFVTKDGKVLVNEVAPRPHNSGHHTIKANETSQFEQHLRAILGLPLGNTDTKNRAAMVNILGMEGYSGIANYEGLEDIMKMDGVHVHLYGKKFIKPHRKMGHITIIDDNPDKLREKVTLVKNTIKAKSV